MTVDYIIIGQGICGTWLSYYLLKENKSIVVFDKNDNQTASKVASGLINPVTGRRVVTTWMADELLPFCRHEYSELGKLLNIDAISQNNIIVFPFAPDLQQAFIDRMKEDNSYIKSTQLKKDVLSDDFNFPFDVFEIAPCYVVQMKQLLRAYKAYLQKQSVLSEAMFDENLISFRDEFVQYKHIKARRIIYADGIQSAQSVFWKNLPFVKNKGQALLIEIEGLNTSYVYKFGHITLIPFEENIWWVGSSNELNFNNPLPNEDFKASTILSLKSILKKEFAIKEHWAALRPATVERRPFVGIHPSHKQIGILNGMGSKGCSLAPWFAKQFTDNLVYNKPIDVSADVHRYSKILSK